MLFPPPCFLGTMFCNVVTELEGICTCIVSDVALLRGSRELDRKIGVGVGVLGVSGISGSIDRSISSFLG